MKKEIASASTAPKSKDPEADRNAKPRAKSRLPAMPAPLRAFLGPKPLITYGHRAALKVFEGLGSRFEVRHFGESRIGLLRWPLRKVQAGKPVRRLVFVPGFGDTPLSWWTILAGMKPILRRKVDEIVLVDFPGYSGFLHDEAAFDSMDELLRVFREVVQSLRPEILVGHSLGGWLAADFAVEHGDGLKELILVDPGGVVESEEDKAAYRRIFSAAVDDDVDEMLTHCFAKAPVWLPFFQEEFMSFLKAEEVRSFVASFEDRHLLNDRIGKVRAATTVIWGEKDTMTPAKWIELWTRLLPKEVQRGGVLVLGSGHSPQVERPGVMIALLTQIFLGQRLRNLPMNFLWKVL